MKGLQRKLKLRGCSSAYGVAFVGERWLQLMGKENKLPLCRLGSLLLSSDYFVDALSAGGCLYCSTVVNVKDSQQSGIIDGIRCRNKGERGTSFPHLLLSTGNER